MLQTEAYLKIVIYECKNFIAHGAKTFYGIGLKNVHLPSEF